MSIDAFVCVAETQSFANAARQVGVAKSVVTTRTVESSESGEIYYRNNSGLLQKAQDFSRRSQGELSVLKDTLRIHRSAGVSHLAISPRR